ncbi:hypothetical protein LCGC14_2289820 [marine sediment metagenome]|uniref:Uncharacterized protein n=1 Tax=marine sediment metagenome TaxID=412755 RepID=A0A0F9CS36_9ZZZZ
MIEVITTIVDILIDTRCCLLSGWGRRDSSALAGE